MPLNENPEPSELTDQVKQALKEAGAELKSDIWKPEDEAFLLARAADLVGLNKKVELATTPAKRAAYQAAAQDVVNHVKLVALIRLEVATQHILDALGRFFTTVLLPRLVQLLPALAVFA